MFSFWLTIFSAAYSTVNITEVNIDLESGASETEKHWKSVFFLIIFAFYFYFLFCRRSARFISFFSPPHFAPHSSPLDSCT